MILEKQLSIKRALISVSNKQGIVEFAKQLHALGVEIISTGGTHKVLINAGIPAKEVAAITDFPEVMDGRVKTLHSKIFGGILGRRDKHTEESKLYHIDWIDLVVVNLYPFKETVQQRNVTLENAIENIDVGGPSMIRAAAKNMEFVTVVVDPNDYADIITKLKHENTISSTHRSSLATKAFAYTADYDACIHQYLSTWHHKTHNSLPHNINLSLTQRLDLRYGENPNQIAGAYQLASQTNGILAAKQHQGKSLSYNNLLDTDAAFALISEFTDPTCVVIKHTNPCGVASRALIFDAFTSALACDPLSAFGGIIALNRLCDEETANAIVTGFFEVLIAPGFTKNSLRILSKKTNLRVLEIGTHQEMHPWMYQSIEGGLLVQEKNLSNIGRNDLKMVTHKKPSLNCLDHLLFAWHVVKHVKSNAIVIVNKQQTLGIGAGQVSRVDAVEIALRKFAHHRQNQAVLASDAFFPFRDSIDKLANTGISAIIQPGGSMRDQEVIDACNEHGIAMVLTGVRCFKH